MLENTAGANWVVSTEVDFRLVSTKAINYDNAKVKFDDNMGRMKGILEKHANR